MFLQFKFAPFAANIVLEKQQMWWSADREIADTDQAHARWPRLPTNGGGTPIAVGSLKFFSPCIPVVTLV
jgi:hypothetical protein